MQKQSNEELIKLIKQEVDTQDNYEKLYKQNRGFIYQIIIKRVHGIYECDDLMQQAFLALVRAVNYYNCELQETNFLTLLKYCIWNELREETSRLPAHMIQKIMKYKKAYGILYDELGRRPKNYELMLELNIDLNQLEEIRKANQINYPLSLDEPISDDEGAVTRLDLYIDSQADEEAAFENMENIIDNIKLKAVLEEALNKLPERTETVIKDRYYKGKSLEECGKEIDVSRERIRQIENEGFRKLRKDYVLRRKVDGYINEYKYVGVNQFNNTRTSSVEWLAIKREQMLKRLKDIGIEYE